MQTEKKRVSGHTWHGGLPVPPPALSLLNLGGFLTQLLPRLLKSLVLFLQLSLEQCSLVSNSQACFLSTLVDGFASTVDTSSNQHAFHKDSVRIWTCRRVFLISQIWGKTDIGLNLISRPSRRTNMRDIAEKTSLVRIGVCCPEFVVQVLNALLGHVDLIPDGL